MSNRTSNTARPILRTQICDLFGIEYPVLLAGMGPTVGGSNKGVAGPELVAAVSNAGGLGVLGGTGFGPDEMEQEILRIRELTDKPFGVDILLPVLGPTKGASDQMPNNAQMRAMIPAGHVADVEALRLKLGLPESASTGQRNSSKQNAQPMASALFDPQSQIDVITGMGVAVLATGLGDPAPFMRQLRDAGTKVISLVGNVKGAQKVLAAGVDAVVAQGTEAGGHTGRIGTMALLPQVLDVAGSTPVIAAGGIGDGRGLAAALAMGCDGVWCGTIFIGTHEAQLDELRKLRFVEANEESTKITKLYSGKTMRNITNPLVEAWEESGIKALPLGLQSMLIAPLMRGSDAAGRYENGMNAGGQIAGLIKQIRPAGDVVTEMIYQAAEIIGNQLARRIKTT
jgi:nitronate monooxygenase